MNIWEISPPEADYEWVMISPQSARPFELAEHIDGRSLAANWIPPKVDLLHVEDGRPLAHADIPWESSFALICRPSALAVVGDLLRAHGELLPVECDEELIAFNCTVTIAALDLERSEIARFPTSGRIMVIDRHIFDPARLGNPVIFRPAECDHVSPIYVGDEFRDRVLAAGLTGLDFRLLWSTDPNAEIPPPF